MLESQVVTIDKWRIESANVDSLGNPVCLTLNSWVQGAKKIGTSWLFDLPVWDVSGESESSIEVNIDDPRDNVKRLFDTSEAPDPIGIEGIGWMEKQLGGLDRLIVEGCYLGYKVSDPRIDFSDRTPQHLKAEVVQRRIGKIDGKDSSFICSLADAETLCASWKALEITSKIANVFINHLRKSHDIVGAISNCTTWAVALDEVTVHPDEFIPDEQELWNARDNTDDEDPEEWPEESATAHAAFRWAPIGITEYDNQKDWLSCQPMWYRKLITDVKSITEHQKLADIKKDMFQKTGDWSQSALFWWTCAIQERKLETLSRPALKVLLKWIKSTKKGIGFIGKYLFTLSENKNVHFSNRQLSVAWASWRAKKAKRNRIPVMLEPPTDYNQLPLWDEE